MSFYLVTTSVADLRREPIDLLPKDYSHHPLRESQLLYGERLICHEKEDDWLYIEAIEQQRYSKERGWHGYPGWIHVSEATPVEKWPKYTHLICAKNFSLDGIDLSYGTLLCDDSDGIALPNGKKISSDHPGIRSLTTLFNPQQIVADSILFLGTPYLWGGRAFHLKETISSVDCSSLIHLLYRAQGIFIPRDAHDQAMKMMPTIDLKPGDPLYLAKEDSERITHVILYCGEDTFIESPESGKQVRYLKKEIDFWIEENRYIFKEREGKYEAYPRSLLGASKIERIT